MPDAINTTPGGINGDAVIDVESKLYNLLAHMQAMRATVESPGTLGEDGYFSDTSRIERLTRMAEEMTRGVIDRLDTHATRA